MDKNKIILRSHKMKIISYKEDTLFVSVINESDPDESDPVPNSDLETILKRIQTALNSELKYQKIQMILTPVTEIKEKIQPILQQIQSPSPLVKKIIQDIETLKPEILKEQLKIVSQLLSSFKELKTMNEL